MLKRFMFVEGDGRIQFDKDGTSQPVCTYVLVPTFDPTNRSSASDDEMSTYIS